MTLERTAGICFCVVITSAIATAQSKSDTTGQGQGPGRRLIEITYDAGDVPPPLRHVETRSTSGGREVVVETDETLNIEGRLAPLQEAVTETTRTAPNATQSTQDVSRFTVNHQRALWETTESRQDSQPNGDTSAVQHTRAPDLNGHLRSTFGRIEQTRSSGPDVRRSDTTLLTLHFNELRESERTESMARRIKPEVVQHNSTGSVRDINGRWQSAEIRRGEVRAVGPSERIEDETIQRPDMDFKLAVAETNVVRRSNANDQDDEVIETYAPSTLVSPRVKGQLILSQRVHRTSTATADGGRYTVEEVEGRNVVALNEPLRVIRRTVTTVRRIGTDRWVTERQVFERDLNGRLQLVAND